MKYTPDLPDTQKAIDWSASSFFDLEGFAHAALFEGDLPVWTALKNVKQYLTHSLRRGIHPGALVMDGAILIGDDIQIGDGCVIEPGAFVRGPVLLGRGCEVRHGAYLRGDIVAGDGCVFGHASEFKNAILLNGAKAAHFNYVGDSILGARVNMGAGSKLSNVKMIHGNVSVSSREGRIDSGLRKFGAILGDDVEVGCNAVLNPGTILGPRCMVYPNASVRGCHGARSVLKLVQTLDSHQLRSES